MANRLSLAIGLTLFWGCGDGGSKDTITLGAILDRSGPLASPGEEFAKEIQLAVDEINAGGGVLGRPLALAFRDDATDADRSMAAVTDLLVNVKAPAIIGSMASGPTVANTGLTIPARALLLSPSATTPALTALEDADTVFRVAPSDARQVQLSARRARGRGINKAAVIYVPGPFGQGQSAVFEQTFEMLGGQVVFNDTYVAEQSSYKDLLTRAFAAEPEAILLAGYQVDAAQMIKDYNSAFSAKQVFWMFTDSLAVQTFVDGAGASSFTFRHEGTTLATPTDASQAAFIAAYNAKYPTMPRTVNFSGNAYDSVYLLALAIQKAGKVDSLAMRDHLREISNPPGMAVGPGQWSTALAAIAAGSKINYQGASGNCDFDAQGDVANPYDVWQVQAGKITYTERALPVQ